MELGRIGRCIIYDRRGFYRSGRPEPFDAVGLAEHVDDAAALLEILHAAPASSDAAHPAVLEFVRRFAAARD